MWVLVYWHSRYLLQFLSWNRNETLKTIQLIMPRTALSSWQGIHFFFRFVLWCDGLKFGQISGNSSSSQIPGTSNSKACCCWGDLNMGIFSAFLSLLRLWIGPGDIIFGIYSVIEIFCVVTAACLNYNIFVAVRRHAHQIQALQVQQVAQNEEVANFGRMRKSAVATVFVYVVFLDCYLPNICGLWIGTMAPEFLLTSVARYLLTLLFLSSSLNPLIYCWKMRHIRHNIVNTLRDAFSC